MNLILLLNVKMPTIVGILTFISKTNAASEIFKQVKKYFTILSSNEQLEIHAKTSRVSLVSTP